jgi:N utilization substance protein B
VSVPTLTKVTAENCALHFGCADVAPVDVSVTPDIPTKVTLNEYIEISKFYSTPKSNGFINGVLDKAIDRLKKEKKIVKIGRGLIN